MRLETQNTRTLRLAHNTGSAVRFTPARGPQGLPGPGSAAWAADTAVTTGAVRQAPDGSWIKSTGNRTTRPTFDATEATFWEAVLASSGTVEATALTAAMGAEAVGRKSTAAQESAALGAELAGSSGWTLGAGWAGTFAGGFVHTPGSTAALTFDLNALAGEVFLVEFDVASVTDSSAFAVTIGGSFPMVMYEGATGGTWTYARGIMADANGDLSFTPETTFDGTISNVSVKKVTTSAPAASTWADSTDTTAAELRLSTAALNNLFLGIDAGRFNITGHENAAVGHLAMRSSVSGFWNAALGYKALEANVNGTRNVALGYRALVSNISGHRNVAIGSFAMNDNTDGINNIALGADSLWVNTTGNGNIALGLASLGQSATGDDNIGIGIAALGTASGITGAVGVGYYANSQLATTSEPPVAVGYRALRDATVGGNVAVGHEALRLDTTGTGNVGVGFRAGYANLTGSQQTAIGYNALRYFTGGRNTAVGYGAMTGVNGSSTGTRNVVVGDSAGAGLTSGANNVIVGGSAGSALTSASGCIVIGFNAQNVNGTDGSILNIGNTIWGNLTAGRIGIGTNTMIGPTARLHLQAGVAAASGASLKINAGTLLTTPEAGAIEFDGTNLYFTTSGGTRKTITAT